MDYRIIEMLQEIKLLLAGKINDKWLKIDEVSKYASLSESTLRRAMRKGTLKASQVTGRLLFKKSNIDKWLNKKWIIAQYTIMISVFKKSNTPAIKD